mgnify:FL=1
MKSTRYILFLFLLAISSTLVAQPRLRHPELYIGAHAGVMASSITFKPTVKGIDLLQSPLSINGGLVVRYAAHKVCALQLELNYMQRGWREMLPATATSPAVDYRRQLDYIQLPLLMHLAFGNKFRGFLNLGPQIGYCFRDTEYGTKNPLYTHHYVPIQQPFDWGLAGGLGMYYRSNKIGTFQLEARFNYSLGSVFNNRITDYFTSANPMNLSVNFAYLWEIKIK